jgi:non-ribosomal peptide synthase protein (TIGR01720 family)
MNISFFASKTPNLLRRQSFPNQITLIQMHYKLAIACASCVSPVKEQLRQIPNRGIGYGVLRYLSQDKQLQSLPQPQISFNYLGQLDGVRSSSMLLGFAKDSTGLTHCPQGYRSHLLEIDGFVVDGKLQLKWTYSKSFHHRHTIKFLAGMFIKTLESLIYHCADVEVGSYTPSDFPEAGLNQHELELLLGKLSV